MPLLEHVLELRNRLAISGLALLVGTVLMWFFFNPVWDFLKQPYCHVPQSHRLSGESCALVVTGIFEGFFLRLKVSFILGIVVSCPIWLYEIWAFITPALRQRERRWTVTFLSCAVPLFGAGAVLAYVTLSKGLEFLLGVNPHDVLALVTVSSYLSFALAMLLIFGISFEFPLVLVLLNFMGVLSYRRLRSWWRPMVLGIFVFAAVATPSQDPFTMSALAVPMSVLYWIAVGVAYLHDKRKARREAESPFADLSDDEASPLEPAF
ncbi:MAG: twin-arginine translocase subunit TatC [Actinomycetes bacterium]